MDNVVQRTAPSFLQRIARQPFGGSVHVGAVLFVIH